MSQMQVLGETKLKRDATCPVCKQYKHPAGSAVEIMSDDTGQQFATFRCKICNDYVMIR